MSHGDVTSAGCGCAAREVCDERGGRHLFEYDAHGNCIARTFPNGARYEFTYDYYVLDLASLLHEVKIDADGEPESVRTYFAGNPTGYSSGGVVSPGLNTPPAGVKARNNGCGEQCFA